MGERNLEKGKLETEKKTETENEFKKSSLHLNPPDIRINKNLSLFITDYPGFLISL